MNIGHKIIEYISDANLVSPRCVQDESHDIINVWSSQAPEQLEALVVKMMRCKIKKAKFPNEKFECWYSWWNMFAQLNNDPEKDRGLSAAFQAGYLEGLSDGKNKIMNTKNTETQKWQIKMHNKTSGKSRRRVIAKGMLERDAKLTAHNANHGSTCYKYEASPEPQENPRVI